MGNKTLAEMFSSHLLVHRSKKKLDDTCNCGWEAMMWFNGFVLYKESCSKGKVDLQSEEALKHPISSNLLAMKVSQKFPTNQ